jgi:hypothetical protein
MGDCGSVPLGFLAAAFGLAGIHAQTWPGWFPLLVFLPFIADTLVTLVKRSSGREPFSGAQDALLSAPSSIGCRTRGHAAAVRNARRRHLRNGVTCADVTPAAGWQVLGAWTVAIGGLFAGIDYHWRRCSAGQR